MKIFLDTAKLREIKKVKPIIDGLTTNPSLLNKAVESLKKDGKKINLESYIKKILKLIDGPVSLEVRSVSSKDMVAEAERLYRKYNKVNKNVVIKIPVSTFTGEDSVTPFEGLKAISKLKGRIPTNATLVMTISQAILAAKSGATYVSPFIGRVDDYIKEQLNINQEKSTYWDGELWKKITEKIISRTVRGSCESEMNDSQIRTIYNSIIKSQNLVRDEGIYSGVDLVKKIILVYKHYSFETKIIAASIRNKRQVDTLAVYGVDIVTVPFSVLLEMETHYKTKEGRKNFDRDAKNLKY